MADPALATTVGRVREQDRIDAFCAACDWLTRRGHKISLRCTYQPLNKEELAAALERGIHVTNQAELLGTFIIEIAEYKVEHHGGFSEADERRSD